MPIAVGIRTDLRAFLAFTGRVDKLLDAPLRAQDGLRGGAVDAMKRYAAFTRRRFDAASAGDGTWPALKRTGGKRKPQTAARRILVVSGRLYGSLLPYTAGNIFDVLADRVRYGTSVPYARFHQRGGDTLPRRAILVAPEADVLARCVEPMADAWRKAINDCVSSTRMAA